MPNSTILICTDTSTPPLLCKWRKIFLFPAVTRASEVKVLFAAWLHLNCNKQLQRLRNDLLMAEFSLVAYCKAAAIYWLIARFSCKKVDHRLVVKCEDSLSLMTVNEESWRTGLLEQQLENVRIRGLINKSLSLPEGLAACSIWSSQFWFHATMWHRNQYHLKIKKRNCGSQTEPNRTMAQFGCEVGFTLVIFRLDQSQKSEPNKLFLMFLHICFFFHLESTCPRWQIHSSVHWLVQTRPWCWSTVTVKCLTLRKTFQQSKT